MITSPHYTVEAITGPHGLSDFRIFIDGKTWHMWGKFAHKREQELARSVPENALPVMIGSGLGICLKELAQRGPIAVIDKEHSITTQSTVAIEAKHNPNITLISTPDITTTLAEVAQWRTQNQNRQLVPLSIPFYQRLDREYYAPLEQALISLNEDSFWEQANYPKFTNQKPRILFFDSSYFLCAEIKSALKNLDIPCHSLALRNTERGNQGFIEELLKTVIQYKPDFVLTVNHFGLDREGKLASLLADLGLPLASWFVDNPHLILHDYAHPATENTAIFTFDAGNLDILHDKGFNNTHYLPLATDPARFSPHAASRALKEWDCDVSFVGNSMQAAVASSLQQAKLPADFQNDYQQIAAGFGASSERNVIAYLKTHQSQWYDYHAGQSSHEIRLAIESLLTWEATRQYRLQCVGQTLKFNPLIVGDTGWRTQLDHTSNWRHVPGLDYYTELPAFYGASTINFNCTSRQMIGAVNQRVFDVPASGGFLITDYREQMEQIFDLNSEAITYRTPEEIPGLIRKYLADDKTRQRIIQAARHRILAHHTYEIRLTQLIKAMRDTFTSSR